MGKGKKELKIAFEKGKYGKSVACIKGIILEDSGHSSSIIYIGKLKEYSKGKYGILRIPSVQIQYKGRLELVSLGQKLSVEMAADVRDFLRGRKTLEEISSNFY